MMLSLVVPVLNEEETIPRFYEKVRESALSKDYEVEIVFIDDGSTDKTPKILSELSDRDRLVSVISFTRNFGKEAAIFAGLEHATGEAVIPMDVDLQDPIEIVPLLVEKWQEGAEVVLAKRIDRSTDGMLKSLSAGWFYKLHNRISTPHIEENVGDFRLLSPTFSSMCGVLIRL